METKLFNDDFVLDISRQKIQIQESNSRFNNQSFTKFTFPFEVFVEDQFIHYVGDYSSFEVRDLNYIIPCYLLLEGKIHEAELQVISIQGNQLTGQVDFGLEEVPNFDTKLSELPLHNFTVDDIYVYAKNICGLNYPATDFNFPRMYTNKYSPDSEIWDAFDGYYNDLKSDGSEMRRNYLDEELNIFNVNIIHPCPHVLYLLKTGFGDKGYELAGDILTDSDLAQRWVFSGTKYFTTLAQIKNGIEIDSLDYDFGFITFTYFKSMVIEKKGTYKIKGFFNLRGIKGNGIAFIGYGVNYKDQIWSTGSKTFNEHKVKFNIDITTQEDNVNIYFWLNRATKTFPVVTVIKAEIIGDELDVTKDNQEESNVVTNLNEVDLRRAVPEMTFGEFVNIIKNWFNYDLTLEGKTIIMNRLDKDPNGIKDFRKYELAAPKRTFSAKKSFLIKFKDLDNDEKKNAMYYDVYGPKLNGAENEDTTIIEINGYAMPVYQPKPSGYTTAVVKKDSDSTVALVYYNGLDSTGQNNAQNPAGCDFPELFPKNWEKWLRQRITGNNFESEFYAYITDLSNFNIKDYIFWHNNIHQITSWTKEMVTEDVYKVNIQTETII